MKTKLILLMLLACVLVTNSFPALGGNISEGQRSKTAEKYFLAKQYDKAAPLFAQLVSNNPKSYKYNYYYGICLLIIGEDKGQALPYLETAMENPKTPEDIYYYYGRACHLTYKFEESVQSFVEFNSIIGAKSASHWSIPKYIEMVNNAKRILDTTKLASIQEKNKTLASDFYSKYSFNQPNGKLLSMPDQLITASKSDKDESPTIFLSANGRVMYFSAWATETSSRDIFRVEKDLDENWGEPKRIEVAINSKQDELLPTCNSDGRILYFSSRGHTTTGGFDLFKAYYNTMSMTWSAPENMGSPYNSPDDDFCYVPSTVDQTAYFTSQRETAPGTLTVFKVTYANTEELPIAINGKFNCIGNAELKEIQITITRDGDSTIVANVSSDKITGSYVVELPGPGNYSFKVEAAGYLAHTENVRFGEFSDRIYVQDIFLSKSLNGMEDIAISNRRLTEAGLVGDNLTANYDEEGNVSGGITEADMAAMKLSGIDPAVIAAKAAKAALNNAELMKNDGLKVDLLGNITFKVQIGAFRKSQKEEVQKRLEKKADKSLMSNYNDLTWLRFFVGGEVSYSSAKNLRTTLKQAGFRDAFVVAFKNEKPVNLQKAISTKK